MTGAVGRMGTFRPRRAQKDPGKEQRSTAPILLLLTVGKEAPQIFTQGTQTLVRLFAWDSSM